ncbi:amino acid transporter [Ramicandelaber brevisporus]|nr:amino acid transporter [Ramicandelaber brevisporus]
MAPNISTDKLDVVDEYECKESASSINHLDSPLEPDAPALEPTMSAFQGAFFVASSCIGAGIYTTPGLVIATLGGPVPAIVMWIIGAIVSFAGAFSYIELGLLMPVSGAEIVYLREIFRKPRKMLSFMFTLFLVFLGGPPGDAALGTAMGKYLLYTITGPVSDYPEHSWLRVHQAWISRGLAIACILSASLWVCLSTKWSLRLITVLSALKIAVLTIISISGMIVLIFGGLPGGRAPRQLDGWKIGFQNIPSAPYLWAAAFFDVTFTYSGWNAVNSVTSEVKNPRRNLPIATICGLGMVTMCYLLANISYMSVVPLSVLLDNKHNHETIAADFCERVMGPIVGQRILPAFVALSGYGCMLSGRFASSRMIMVAANAGYIPCAQTWRTLHSNLKTPINAVVLATVLSIVYLLAPPPGDAFGFLVNLGSYPFNFFSGLVVAGIFILVKRERKDGAVVKASSIPYVIARLLYILFMSHAGAIPYYLAPLLGAIFILLGMPAYYFLVYRNLRDTPDADDDNNSHIITSVTESTSASVDLKSA